MKTYEENLKYIQRLMQNIDISEDKMLVLSDKHVRSLAKLLTKKERDEKSEIAFIVGYIKSHGEIEYWDEDIQEKERIRAIIKNYKHGINLTPIKGDIEYTYDKKNTMFLNWHNKYGQGMDVVAEELENRGVFLNSENSADQFIEMQNLLSQNRAIYAKDHYSSSQIKKMLNEENDKNK